MRVYVCVMCVCVSLVCLCVLPCFVSSQCSCNPVIHGCLVGLLHATHMYVFAVIVFGWGGCGWLSVRLFVFCCAFVVCVCWCCFQ